MMCTVDVAPPEDSMSLSAEGIHILREFTVEDDLPFPGIFGFPSIGEVDTEDIQDFLLFFWSLRGSSLIFVSDSVVYFSLFTLSS